MTSPSSSPARIPAALPKIDALPEVKISYNGTDPRSAGVLSSVSSNLDASGKGQIVIENFHDLTNGNYATGRAGAQREFIKIDIDCAGDAAKIESVRAAYARLLGAVGRTGGHEGVNAEALEQGVKELLALGTVAGKNSWSGASAVLNLEPRFKQLVDTARSVIGAGDYLVAPANDVEHAVNVLLNRHTIAFKGPSAGLDEMRVVCDIRRAYIELVDGKSANAQRLKFEIKDLTNPMGDASAVDTQAERLTQRIFGEDLSGNSGYYGLLKAENSKGDELAENSALFRAVRDQELAVQFDNIQIVNAAIRVKACDQGLKFNKGSIQGKKGITAMLDVDGRVEMTRFNSYGNAAISLNSPKSELKDCSFRRNTLISGDLSESKISAGCEFYDVIWVAKAVKIQIDHVGQKLAGRWKGTLIDSGCLEAGSDMIKVLQLVTCDKAPEVVSARISAILTDASIVELFKKNGAYVAEKEAILNGIESLMIAEPDDLGVGQRKSFLQVVPDLDGRLKYRVKFSYLKDEDGNTEDREKDFDTKAEALENVRTFFRHQLRGYFDELDRAQEAADRAEQDAAAAAAGGGGRGGRGGPRPRHP